MYNTFVRTPITNRTILLRVATITILVYGITLLIVSTTLRLRAQLVIAMPNTSSTLHTVAPLAPLSDDTSKLLFLGMLTILVGYLSYALYILRAKQWQESRTWRKIVRWFDGLQSGAPLPRYHRTSKRAT